MYQQPLKNRNDVYEIDLLKIVTNTNKFFLNDLQTKYIGSNLDDIPEVKLFFSIDVVNFISKQCTTKLQNVDYLKRDIIIPDKRIIEVMNTVFLSFVPGKGFDAKQFTPVQYVESMIKQTIERIVYDVENTLLLEQCNMQKTVWTSVLGDFNNHKLRSHAPIKINNRHPNRMQFNMHY